MVLHQCIRPLLGARWPGHHGHQRARHLFSGQASMGHSGHQCSHAPGRPILHLISSSRRPRRVGVWAISMRVPGFGSSDQVAGRSPPQPCAPRSSGQERERSRRCGPACWRARLPRRCGGAASWRPRPSLEPVMPPPPRLDRHGPCRLNEQHAQVAIASLRYLSEDCALPGRDLLRDTPQPGLGFGNFTSRSLDWKSVRPDSSPDSSGIMSPRFLRAKWRPEAPPFQIRSGAPVQPEPPLWRLQ